MLNITYTYYKQIGGLQMSYTVIKLSEAEDENIIRVLEKHQDSNLSFLFSDTVNKILFNKDAKWKQGFTAKNLLTIFKEFSLLDEDLSKKSNRDYWVSQEGYKDTKSNQHFLDIFTSGAKCKKQQLDELKVVLIKVLDKFNA